MLAAMFTEILVFLLNVAAGLVAGLCLLRAYLGWLRVPLGLNSGNPVGPLILTVTDPLVLRLRRVLPAGRSVDTASLAAAYAVAVMKLAVLALLGAAPASPMVLVWAFFEVLQLILSGLFGLTIVAIILSWVQSYSPMAMLVERMVSPLLDPIRRNLPTLGGLDLSPMVLLLVLQVLDMVLRTLRWSL